MLVGVNVVVNFGVVKKLLATLETVPPFILMEFVASVFVVIRPVLSATVDPLNAAPGTMPLIELTLKVCVESVWNCAVTAVMEEVTSCCVDVCAKSDISSYRCLSFLHR